MSLPHIGRFLTRAACGRSGVSLLFPGHDVNQAVARATVLCRGCPVVRPCRAWARAHPGERGMWGGLSEAERHAIGARGARQAA